MSGNKKQLKSSTKWLMISTAGFFDTAQAILQIIPWVGQVLASLIGGLAFGTFWLWFKFYGISFATPKRGAIMGGGLIIELIPIINALPTWTLAVALILADLKKDELLGKDGDDSSDVTDINEYRSRKRAGSNNQPVEKDKAA